MQIKVKVHYTFSTDLSEVQFYLIVIVIIFIIQISYLTLHHTIRYILAPSERHLNSESFFHNTSNFLY